MSDVATLKSYLVNLGFQVDQPSLGQFTGVLKATASLVQSSTGAIAGDILKWQAAVIGMFTAVSGAVVTAMDKVAMADQEYRLFGERMFMDTAHAKSLKIALDALGQPLEAIAFDPELHGRFVQLQKDQAQLMAGLGTGFEKTMLGLRDVRFEFTRFGVEMEYLTQGVVSQLFKQLGFGNGGFAAQLGRINDYIIAHIPEWSRLIATYLVPILKDTWRILVDVAKLVGVFATEFTNLVGILSGDSSLTDTTFNFDKFARSVDKVANAIAWLLDKVLLLEQHLPVLEVLGGAAAGAVVGSIVPGVGTAAGAMVGGVGAGILGMLGRSGTASTASANASGDVSAQAHALAQSLSTQLNVPADILYAQWAHETGNFTSRGATQLNNLAGIRIPGSTEYRSFASVQDFGNYYSKMLHGSRYSGAMGARTVDQFVTPLKRGGYMEAPLASYEQGMQRFMPRGSGGGGMQDNSVTIGDIHITQPGASADEIANTVTRRIEAQRKMRVQQNLAELTSVYG